MSGVTEITAPVEERPAIRWTDDQLRAIDERGGHLVVAASAGAGKTAVLTERVLRWLTEPGADGEPPAELSELLVITFTEKAARQMRERIEARLHAALAEADPEEPRAALLRRALDDIPSAWIMTIDAFCRRVVLEHFHQAGLPPAPRVPDTAELADLEGIAVRDTLEAWSAEDHPRRADLLELLEGAARGEETLVAQLLGLMHFLASLDRPDLWRAGAEERVARTLAATSFSELPEAADAARECGRGAAALAEALDAVADAARECGAEPCFFEQVTEARAILGEIAAAAGPLPVDALDARLAAGPDEFVGKISLKKVCGAALYASPLKARSLEPLRRRWQEWRDAWFGLDEPALLAGARLAARRVDTLLALAAEAERRAGVRKTRRGLVTFNDFQRHTLAILSDRDCPEAPSAIAIAYRERFRAVMVDEYQDTSPLQDAIVARVARGDDPSGLERGNLFLVGDYKQSIYRFRHADPLLFRSKLDMAEPAVAEARGAGGFQRVDLRENFRSRPDLLRCVNGFFERLMDRAIGEVDYADRERLVAGLKDEPGDEPDCVEVCWLPKASGRGGAPADAAEDDDADTDPAAGEPAEAEEALEGTEAQAAWVARRIRALVDAGEAAPGDCAILLRSLRGELDLWARALAREGLAVRAPGVSPLLVTVEMLDLVAALRVADNPLQDLPLAVLLRSPIGGFGDEDLLRIRMRRRRGPFHEAYLAATGAIDAEPGAPELPSSLAGRLARFDALIAAWRGLARRAGAADVLEAIVRESAFEAWLAGRTNAMRRLEHVDWLRRLAARFGRSEGGANPLARMLELIDGAGGGEEMGELPESLADPSGAVNLLTIHKSKGLEFPVVFLPRLERRLRHPASGGAVLFDREAGIAAKGFDTASRREYETLGWRALLEAVERKDRSEELRLLYVAMTRARRRLVLVGQVADPQIATERWAARASAGADCLGVLERLRAPSALDLLAPIIEAWRRETAGPPAWLVVHEGGALPAPGGAEKFPLLRRALARLGEDPAADWRAAMSEVAIAADGAAPATAADLRLIPPPAPGHAPSTVVAKTTVTALRRAHAAEPDEETTRFEEAEMLAPVFIHAGGLAARRPHWSGEAPGAPDAALAGTWTHALMAHADLAGALDAADLRATVPALIARGLIDPAGHSAETVLAAIDIAGAVWFFETVPGLLMRARPGAVSRELPFTATRPLFDIAPDVALRHPGERFLLQGIIDAVIDDGDRAMIIDYKSGRPDGERLEAYRSQVALYAESLRAIWNLREVEGILAFLGARSLVRVAGL